MGTLARASRVAALEGVVGTGGPADAGVLKLFINNPSITEDSVVADFTEPTFTGYAEISALAFGAVYQGPSGQLLATAPGGLFQRTGGAISEVANGYFIVDTAETGFVYAAYFDTPVSFAEVGDGVFLDATIGYGD